MRDPAIMSTSEPPRDFSKRVSYVSLPSSESDFHIPDDTQCLLITNLSDGLRDYLLNKRMCGVRFTVDDHNILRMIMPSRRHEYIVGMFSAFFPDAMISRVCR